MAKTPKPTFSFPTVNGAQLRDLFDVQVAVLNDLANRNIIRRVARDTYDFRESIRSYTAHLRGMAARTRSADGIDSVKESALLNRERRRVIRQEGEVAAGNLLPVPLVKAVMEDHIKGVRAMIEAIPSRAMIEMPHLPAIDIDTIKSISREVLRDNVYRVIEDMQMHPELQDFIDKKQGKS